LTEKSIIIIGAGLAGLSTGIYARMNGYRTHIFEHRAVPGGVAAAWKRSGYLIDGGIHFIMGYRPGSGLHELYRQLGVAESDRFVEMTKYGRYIDETNGRSVTVDSNLDRLAEDLKAISPVDAAIVDDLISGARAIRGMDMSELGLAKPPELTSFLDQLKEMWQMRRIVKYMGGKYGRTVSNYVRPVKSLFLAGFIKNLFLPQVPVWFVFMVLALVADGQLGYLNDGCLSFVLAIEKNYKKLGGRVTYKATVAEILTENNRAVGVRLADGSRHYADAIVSAADGYSTIFKMLDGRFVNEKIKERYSNWELFGPLVMISYGVARRFPDETPFTTIKLRQSLSVGGKDIDTLFVRIFNYSPRFAAAGKTVVQVEFESQWDFWNDLHHQDREAYSAEKERIAIQVLRHLEEHHPGISRRVEMTDVATPYTTWRYTLNYRGAWEGWMMTPEAVNSRVERTLPGLKNFYMAGQWVMPGGGVAPCLYSGRHAVQLICKQDKKQFVAATD
jgi:phytoene dehydrogenase-like protein